MFMRKRILKWQRDRAVARLARNSEQLDLVRRGLADYRNSVPSEERRVGYVLDQIAAIERLRQQVEDDKNFIRKTA